MLITAIKDVPPQVNPTDALAVLEHVKRELAKGANTLTARTMITKLELFYERKL